MYIIWYTYTNYQYLAVDAVPSILATVYFIFTSACSDLLVQLWFQADVTSAKYLLLISSNKRWYLFSCQFLLFFCLQTTGYQCSAPEKVFNFLHHGPTKMPPPDVLLIKITLSDEKARLISYFWQNFSLDNHHFLYAKKCYYAK